MKRLRDMREQEPMVERAQKLLAAVEPVDSSVERMQRVLLQVEQRASAPKPPPRRVALLLAATFVLAGTALAAAQKVDAIRGLLGIETGEAKVIERPERARVNKQSKVVSSETETDTDEQPAIPVLEPQPTPAPQPATTRRHHKASTPSADAELVRRAVMALRRDGDAHTAGQLLERVHAKGSAGPLAEEVMSLRVEAALARGDGRAEGYAKQYLRRYPNGRYRAVVERALGGR